MAAFGSKYALMLSLCAILRLHTLEKFCCEVATETFEKYDFLFSFAEKAISLARPQFVFILWQTCFVTSMHYHFITLFEGFSSVLVDIIISCHKSTAHNTLYKIAGCSATFKPACTLVTL